MAEVPRRVNAAQLAARKIRTPVTSKRRLASGNISGAADRNSVPLFANPDAPSFGAANSGGLFGGGLQAPGAFNFSAPVQGISFGSTPKFGSPDPLSSSDPDPRQDTTGEEAARRNKPFRMEHAQSPTPPTFNNLFGSTNQSNGAGTTTDQAAAEIQRRNSPFQIAPAQLPLPSAGFSFGGTSTQEKPANNIFSFNKPQAATPSFSFGSTSTQPANNAFSFSPSAQQNQQPTSGFNFNSAPATAAPSAPTFSFGQTSSNAQPASSGISFGVTPVAEKPAGNLFNFGNMQATAQQPSSTINFGGTSPAEQPKPSLFNFNQPPAASTVSSNSVSAPSNTVSIFQQPNLQASTPIPNLFGLHKVQSGLANSIFSNPSLPSTSASPLVPQTQESNTQATTGASIFSSPKPQGTLASSIFAPQTQKSISFGTTVANDSSNSKPASSLFAPQTQAANPFGATTTDESSNSKSQSIPATSLFIPQTQAASPFGMTATNDSSNPKPPSSLFAPQTQAFSPFGTTATNDTSNSKPASSMFAPKPKDLGTATSSFNQTAQPPPPQNLFAPKISAPAPAPVKSFFQSQIQQPSSSQENHQPEKEMSAPSPFGFKPGNNFFGPPQVEPTSTLGNPSSLAPTNNIFANQFSKPASNMFGSLNQPTPQLENGSTSKPTISFGGVSSSKAAEMPSMSQVTTASESAPAVQLPPVVHPAATTQLALESQPGQLPPSMLNNNIFAKSSWSSPQPVSNLRKVDEPVFTETMRTIEPPSTSNNANSLTAMAPKEISKPFMNGLSGSEHDPQHPDDVETMGLVPDELIAARTPARFTARQRVEFARAFRVRALNVSFLKHIATFPLAQDFSVAFLHYEMSRAELQEVCDRELAALPNGEKRKADGELQPEGESPMKRSKLLGEMGFQTSDILSSNLSPAKPNTTVKNSTTPQVPPPSTSTLFTQPQLSAPQFSPSSTNKKRKADVQISQLDPTGEGAEASSKKVAKVNGTSGSETSNIFKSILADSNKPEVESRSKNKMPSATNSSAEETPRRNPFASLPIPGSSAPASNLFAPKAGSSTPSLFSPQPSSTASNLFTTKPAFTPGSSLFVPKDATANNAPSSMPDASKNTANMPKEVPAFKFSSQSTSTNMFASKDMSSASKEAPPSVFSKPSTSSNMFAPKDVTAAPNIFAPKQFSATGNPFAPKAAPNPEISNTVGAQSPSSSSNLFVPQSASASTNIFAPKPGLGSPSSNPFSPKPKATESSASSSTPIKPPNFGTGPVNFLAQFGKQAEKYSEESEVEAMNKAKMEDFDSEDDDEAEWEANYKAKRAADKKATEDLAKTKRAAFIPGKGFSFGEIAKDQDKPRSPPRSVFSKPSSSNAPTPSIFASLNGSRMSSPGAASSTGSLLDSHIPNKPSAFGNIFGHLSDVESGAESGKGNEADDDETEEDEDDEEPYDDENEGVEDGEEDGSGYSNEEVDEEKKDPTYQPNVDDSVGPGTPVENTGAGIASAKKPSNTFSFGSPANSGTNTPTPTAGRSLFDRITRAPAPATEDKENAVPQIDGTTDNPFAKYQAKSAAESLKPTGDNTWKPDSPIRFGASTPTAPTPPTVNVSAPSPTLSPSVPNLFNITSAPKSASPFAGLFGNSTSKPATQSLFANLGGSNKQSVGFSFGGPSNTSSLFPSAIASTTTSRATSPGITTDGESTNDTGDPDGVHHEQIDLASGGAGEEDEDLVLQVRAKANKYVHSTEPGVPSEWVTQGLGPLKILKHKQTAAARILMRADPSGKVVLNKAILSALNYEANGKTVKVLTSDDAGKGLETWLLQVKTPASAQELAAALEKNKGK